MAWPISAHRLRNRVLRLSSSAAGECCTLLPFFDGWGVVQRVMVVSPASDELRFFAPAEVWLRIRLWGPIELSTSFPTLRVLEYEDLDALTRLWHYDPWWLLTSRDEPRDERSQLLRPTNSVDSFRQVGTVQRLLYTRDLTRVSWVICQKGGSTTWKRFDAAFLPKRDFVEPPRVPKDAGWEWQLAPFWQANEEG